MKAELSVAEKRELRLANRQSRKGLITYMEWCKYLEVLRNECSGVNPALSEILDENDKAKQRLRVYKESPLFRFRIRTYCNYHGYSDIDPNEVVRVISHRKIEIRQMDAVLAQAPIQHIGGFCANTENDTQRWECVSNPNNPVEIITLTKKGWGQGRYRMSDVPKKFYDYNF